MSNNYRSMWNDLEFDLQAHDMLLDVLGKAYEDIYLAQKDRPEGMGYFDFVMSEVHGLRIKELMDEKASGRKVIGSYCVFVPEEIVLAGNATLLRTEYDRFKLAVENLTEVTIDASNLKKGIEIVNNKRKAIHRLAELRKADPAPISGLDALLANQVFFYDNPVRFTESVNKICDELESRIEKKKWAFPEGTPRILMSGCPMAVPNWKLPWIIESAGAVIVGEESCVGERGARNLTDDSGNTMDELMEAIVDRYFNIDCAIFTPNPDRLNHIKEMYAEYRADGVIHYGLQFCQPYLMEAIPIEKALESENIPVLRIETDYSMEDVGQLKTRVRELLEGVEYDRIWATGYGRNLFELSFDAPTVTEIKAYGVGAGSLFMNVATILDIGGQDSKAIALNDNGRIIKFEMNDRCAAGTGKFLEIMARSLGYTIDQFGTEALKATKNLQINSMCTVFAESEVTSLVAKGEDPREIALGLHRSVVRRAVSMLKRASVGNDIVFAGGVAKNPCMRRLLEEILERQVLVSEDPQMVGALGAALLAGENK